MVAPGNHCVHPEREGAERERGTEVKDRGPNPIHEWLLLQGAGKLPPVLIESPFGHLDLHVTIFLECSDHDSPRQRAARGKIENNFLQFRLDGYNRKEIF